MYPKIGNMKDSSTQDGVQKYKDDYAIKLQYEKEKQLKPVKIPNLQDDLKEYQNKSSIEIYQKYLGDYVQNNLQKHLLKVQSLTVGKGKKKNNFTSPGTTDNEDNVFDDLSQGNQEEVTEKIVGLNKQDTQHIPDSAAPFSLDRNKQGISMVKQSSVYKQNFDGQTSKQIQIWPELLFNQGRQFMIIKTWETHEDQSVYKTLRFYNNQFQEIQSIQVEYIQKNVKKSEDDFHSCYQEVSIFSNKESIFFFKRNFKDDEKEGLRLYQHGLFSQESQNELKDEKTIYKIKENRDQDLATVFSKNIQKVEEALNKQFVITFPYNGQDNQHLQIFDFKNIKNFEMQPIFSSESNEQLWNQQTLSSQNSLDNLQSVFHHIEEIEGENGNKMVTFIFIYIQIHLHITLKMSDKNKVEGTPDIHIFQSETFDKNLNPQIQVQKLYLKDEKKDYYYFLNQNNVVQLLYPNHKDKDQKYLKHDQISESIQITQSFTDDHKKINIIKDRNTEHHQCNKLNTSRELTGLQRLISEIKQKKEEQDDKSSLSMSEKQISEAEEQEQEKLNQEEEQSNKKSTFQLCVDKFDQILYINDPSPKQGIEDDILNDCVYSTMKIIFKKNIDIMQCREEISKYYSLNQICNENKELLHDKDQDKKRDENFGKKDLSVHSKGNESIRTVLQNNKENKYIEYHKNKIEQGSKNGDDAHNFEIENGIVKITNQHDNSSMTWGKTNQKLKNQNYEVGEIEEGVDQKQDFRINGSDFGLKLQIEGSLKVHNDKMIETTVLEHWQIYKSRKEVTVNHQNIFEENVDNYTLCFVFSIINYCDGGGNENIRRKSYIFIHKKVREIKEMIKQNSLEKNNKMQDCLINEKDKVNIMGANFKITTIEFDEIRQKQLMSIHDYQDHDNTENDYLYKDILLTFENEFDKDEESGLLAFIYQEYYDMNKNRLICFNFLKDQIDINIMVNPQYTQNMFQLNGLNIIKFCRSSNVKYRDYHPNQLRYQTMFFFEEKVGRYQLQEYQVYYFGQNYKEDKSSSLKWTNEDKKLKPYYCGVGMNQVLFSEKCINDYEFESLTKSEIIPFRIGRKKEDKTTDQNLNQKPEFYKSHSKPLDTFQKAGRGVMNVLHLSETPKEDTKKEKILEEEISGCQIILQKKSTTFQFINLISDNCQNLFKYESKIVKLGQKKFLLNREDANQFAYIVSTQLHDDVIDDTKFTLNEQRTLIRKCLALTMTMKIPTLEYIFINSFEKLKQIDYFSAQEILYGKSICEIAFQDLHHLQEALVNIELNSNLELSIIHDLVKGNDIRKKIFESINFYPSNQVIQHDFNFYGTLQRLLKFKSVKSFKILLKFILDVDDYSEYYNIIMLDLFQIMTQKNTQLNFNEFFELQSKTDNHTCRILKRLQSDQFSIFSNVDHDDFKFNHDDCGIRYPITDFLVEEVCKNIDEREEKQRLRKQKSYFESTEDKKYIVEYSFIDFQYLILGEKIKSDDQDDYEDFNDLQLAKMMITNDQNLKFYDQESVQNIIDMQFERTKKAGKYMFAMYLLLFAFPVILYIIRVERNDNQKTESFSELIFKELDIHQDNILNEYLMAIAMIGVIPFVIIEIVQIKVKGIKTYITDFWNITDFIYLLLFVKLCLFHFSVRFDNTISFEKEAKVFMTIFLFLKILSLAQIFDGFRNFSVYLRKAISDTMPFTKVYYSFVLFVAIGYTALDVDTLQQHKQLRGMGRFFRLTFSQFRTMLFYIDFPNWRGRPIDVGDIKGGKFSDWLHIKIVWVYFYFSMMFMTLIMLNFMIAVIMDTYDTVTAIQHRYKYQSQADQNYDFYELIFFFKKIFKLDPFRVLIFSQSRDLDNHDFYDDFDNVKKNILNDIEDKNGGAEVNDRAKIIQNKLKEQTRKQNLILEELETKSKIFKIVSDEILKKLDDKIKKK